MYILVQYNTYVENETINDMLLCGDLNEGRCGCNNMLTKKWHSPSTIYCYFQFPAQPKFFVNIMVRLLMFAFLGFLGWYTNIIPMSMLEMKQ